MATYNPPPHLFARQLASIRAQTHRNWVCIIADDGSPPEAVAQIERVIGVDAIGDGGEVALLRDGVEDAEEFVFAEVAAVGSVRAVLGIFHFVRCDEFVADAKALDGARPMFEAAVRAAIDRGTKNAGKTAGDALSVLTAEIQTAANGALDEMAAARKRLDDAIDNPAEVERLNTACGGRAAQPPGGAAISQ